MLYQFFPAPGAASKAAPPFVWQCDACEAKEVSPTALLPEGWTDLCGEDENGDGGGAFRIAFCPDCAASDAAEQYQ